MEVQRREPGREFFQSDREPKFGLRRSDLYLGYQSS
jgi:hypothetical protein